MRCVIACIIIACTMLCVKTISTQINGPLFNLCATLIDHQRVRKSQELALQGGGSLKRMRNWD